jgi:hypothetical protein
VSERDRRLEEAITRLREPVDVDPALQERVMRAVRTTPAPRRWVRPVWAAAAWIRRPRTVRVSPLQGLAAAAVLAAVWVGVGVVRPGATPPGTPDLGVASAGNAVQFVIVAPDADAVALVGDFNDWRGDVTPMSRAEGNGVWSVTVPLEPGRYRYAFLVDGGLWVSDPSAPPAPDDEFERPGSVVTVGET